VTRHEPGQVLDVELAAFTHSSLVGIVGPLSGIFQVVHVVAETRQAKDILKVVPRYPPQGILRNEPSHDNTKGCHHLSLSILALCQYGLYKRLQDPLRVEAFPR